MAKQSAKKIAEDTGQSATTYDPHEFVFELDRAIRDQVLERLEQSPRVPLERNRGPLSSGVYVLYWKNKLVYIGKASMASTVSKRTLRARLNEHVNKLMNRQNLAMKDMTCRFLTIESDWFVWAAEFALINHFTPEWNGSGYGSKNPGSGRPGLKSRPNKWATMFPLVEGTTAPAEEDDSDE